MSNTLDTIRELLSTERLEIRPNSEWLGEMDMSDVLELTSKFTIARIMDRDDFTKRWDRHEPISMIEFMYPLLQAMDSVAVEADIEIGGTDQLFNLLVGRDLQQHHGQPPQAVMFMILPITLVSMQVPLISLPPSSTNTRTAPCLMMSRPLPASPASNTPSPI